MVPGARPLGDAPPRIKLSPSRQGAKGGEPITSGDTGEAAHEGLLVPLCSISSRQNVTYIEVDILWMVAKCCEILHRLRMVETLSLDTGMFATYQLVDFLKYPP